MARLLKHTRTDWDYEELVDEIQLKFRDYLDMKELYRQMHDWLCENEYSNWKDNQFPEIQYLHKWHQLAGEEVRYLWRMEKEINSYYKYMIDIDVLVLFLKTHEMVRDGKKFKVNFGEPEIKLWGRVLTDQNGSWRKHPILKYFHHLFRKRVFKHDIEMHRMELYREVYRLAEAVKTYFKARIFLPEKEGAEFESKDKFLQ